MARLCAATQVRHTGTPEPHDCALNPPNNYMVIQSAVELWMSEVGTSTSTERRRTGRNSATDLGSNGNNSLGISPRISVVEGCGLVWCVSPNWRSCWRRREGSEGERREKVRKLTRKSVREEWNTYKIFKKEKKTCKIKYGTQNNTGRNHHFNLLPPPPPPPNTQTFHTILHIFPIHKSYSISLTPCAFFQGNPFKIKGVLS